MYNKFFLTRSQNSVNVVSRICCQEFIQINSKSTLPHYDKQNKSDLQIYLVIAQRNHSLKHSDA